MFLQKKLAVLEDIERKLDADLLDFRQRATAHLPKEGKEEPPAT